LATLVLLIGCSKPPPTVVLDRLAKAYNNHDMNGIIECFEPKAQNATKGIMGLAAGVFGLNGNALMDALPFFSQIAAGSGMLDSLGTVILTPLAVEQEGNIASITYKADVKDVEGNITSCSSPEEVMRVIYISGDWYIAMNQ